MNSAAALFLLDNVVKMANVLDVTDCAIFLSKVLRRLPIAKATMKSVI